MWRWLWRGPGHRVCVCVHVPTTAGWRQCWQTRVERHQRQVAHAWTQGAASASCCGKVTADCQCPVAASPCKAWHPLLYFHSTSTICLLRLENVLQKRKHTNKQRNLPPTPRKKKTNPETNEIPMMLKKSCHLNIHYCMDPDRKVKHFANKNNFVIKPLSFSFYLVCVRHLAALLSFHRGRPHKRLWQSERWIHPSTDDFAVSPSLMKPGPAFTPYSIPPHHPLQPLNLQPHQLTTFSLSVLLTPFSQPRVFRSSCKRGCQSKIQAPFQKHAMVETVNQWFSWLCICHFLLAKSSRNLQPRDQFVIFQQSAFSPSLLRWKLRIRYSFI